MSRRLLFLATFFACRRWREFAHVRRTSGWLPSAGLDLRHLDPGIRRTSVDIVRWDICFPGKREPALIGVCIRWVEFSPSRFFHFEKPYNFPIVGTTNPLLSLISQRVIMPRLFKYEAHLLCLTRLCHGDANASVPGHSRLHERPPIRRNLMKFEPSCMEDIQYA